MMLERKNKERNPLFSLIYIEVFNKNQKLFKLTNNENGFNKLFDL